MKYVAIVLTFVVLLSAAAAGYIYLTAAVTVSGTGIAVAEASSQQSAFDQLKLQLQEGSATGTLFSSQIPGDASEYKFVTYRVQLKNSTWLDAEMVELQVTSREGDVLQLASGIPDTLEARSSGIYEATILTGVNSYVGREVIVTYYIQGQPYTLRAACSN